MKNDNLKFKILPHTADIRIQVFGRTKEQLFGNALLAMTEIMKPKLSGEKGTVRKIELKSIDQAVLLIDFLSEVLCLIQTNKEIYQDVKFKKFSDAELKAELLGQKVDGFGEDIKAVTYHGLEIKQKNNIWEATVLFDV